MLFHAYLRNGIVYVPTEVRLQIGGAYWDVEPVAVEPIANTQGLRRAFFRCDCSKKCLCAQSAQEQVASADSAEVFGRQDMVSVRAQCIAVEHRRGEWSLFNYWV